MRKSKFIFHIINAAIFIALEVAALSMLRNSGPLQDTWFAKGGQSIMSSIWGFTQSTKAYFSLRDTNDSLAIANFHLKARIMALEGYIADSTRISRLSQNGISGSFRYIPAKISKISNNTQHNYIIIDKGAADGVRKGNGVVTEHGAIGIIDGVSEHFSYARSFRNHGMSVSARLGRTGASGPMNWDGIHSNRALLKEIPHHVEVEAGDTVFTSGFSSIFPPDIPLGTTGRSRIINGSTYEIQVHLFEDFAALRYVTIVENLDRAEIKDLEDRQ